MADILLVEKGEGGDVLMKSPLVDLTGDPPEALEVFGAGKTSVNGEYFFTGETNLFGNPVWRLPGSAEMHRIECRTSSWRIYDGGGSVYYANYGGLEGLFPPFEKWVAVPTLSIPPQTFPPSPTIVYPATETDNADIYPDTGISTAIYTSLFTGLAWYDVLKPADERIPGAGEVERLLDEPITLGSISRIQRAAAIQLSWLKTRGVVSSLSVSVSNPAPRRIEIDITAVRPNDSESRYKYLWDQREQAFIGDLRNSNSLPI